MTRRLFTFWKLLSKGGELLTPGQLVTEMIEGGKN